MKPFSVVRWGFVRWQTTFHHPKDVCANFEPHLKVQVLHVRTVFKLNFFRVHKCSSFYLLWQSVRLHSSDFCSRHSLSFLPSRVFSLLTKHNKLINDERLCGCFCLGCRKHSCELSELLDTFTRACITTSRYLAQQVLRPKAWHSLTNSSTSVSLALFDERGAMYSPETERNVPESRVIFSLNRLEKIRTNKTTGPPTGTAGVSLILAADLHNERVRFNRLAWRDRTGPGPEPVWSPRNARELCSDCNGCLQVCVCLDRVALTIGLRSCMRTLSHRSNRVGPSSLRRLVSFCPSSWSSSSALYTIVYLTHGMPAQSIIICPTTAENLGPRTCRCSQRSGKWKSPRGVTFAQVCGQHLWTRFSTENLNFVKWHGSIWQSPCLVILKDINI